MIITNVMAATARIPGPWITSNGMVMVEMSNGMVMAEITSNDEDMKARFSEDRQYMELSTSTVYSLRTYEAIRNECRKTILALRGEDE